MTAIRNLLRIVFASPNIRLRSDLCVGKSLKGNQPSCGPSSLISKRTRMLGSKAYAQQAPRKTANV